MLENLFRPVSVDRPEIPRVYHQGDVAADVDIFLTSLAPQELPTGICGVGYTGYLPPGARLFLAPLAEKETLRAWIATALSTNSDTMAWKNTKPARVFSLGRGEVFNAGAVIQGGLCAFEWLGVGSNPFHPAHANPMNPRASLRWGPASVARCYFSPATVPASLQFSSMPLWTRLEDLPAAAPTLGTEGLGFSPEVTALVLNMQDNAADARIQAGESNTFEVWFRTITGLWCHNPTDDWAPAPGRGQADPTHDVEVYQIPKGFNRVYVRALGGGAGSALWCNVLGTEV